MITDTTKLLEIIQILNLVLESLAIIIAGWWTYSLFILQRIKQPHIDITHRYFSTPIANEKNLLRLTVALKNHGSVVFKSSEIKVLLQQVRPCPSIVLETIQNKENPPMNGGEIKWTLLKGTRVVAGTPQETGELQLFVEEIEPGETDECHFDFIIDNEVQTVASYSYVMAKSTNTIFVKRPPLVWNKTSIWDISPEPKEG